MGWNIFGEISTGKNMTKNDERKLVKNNGKTTISPIAKEGLVKTVTLFFYNAGVEILQASINYDNIGTIWNYAYALSGKSRGAYLIELSNPTLASPINSIGSQVGIEPITHILQVITPNSQGILSVDNSGDFSWCVIWRDPSCSHRQWGVWNLDSCEKLIDCPCLCGRN